MEDIEEEGTVQQGAGTCQCDQQDLIRLQPTMVTFFGD